MAESYSVMPVNDDHLEMLESIGLEIDESINGGRYPTPFEIRGILESLSSYEVQYTISELSWQARISDSSGRWASLVVLDFHGEDEEERESHRFYFEKGWEAVVRIVIQQLVQICGPMVYFSNAEMIPKLMLPEVSS